MKTAAILAGGLGTRLRPAIGDRQKVVAHVAGRPFVVRLLDQLVEEGFEQTVLCTGFDAASVEQELGTSHRGMRLTWSKEERPLGTAGAIRFAADQLLGHGPVVVLNGDSFCEVALDGLLEFHRQRDAAATLTLTWVGNASRYGRVTIDRYGQVERFAEKSETGPGWINAGVYCLSESFLRDLPEAVHSLETDVLPNTVGAYGYRGGGKFIDIGTPESLEAAPRFFDDEHTSSRGTDGRCVLIDRDGTIVRQVHYLSDPEQVVLQPGAAKALRLMETLGLPIAVITNQSGIARKYFDLDAMNAVHRRISELLRQRGVALERYYYCPHRPEDGCNCRKPARALADRAAAELGCDIGRSFVIGDKRCDTDLGANVGAIPIHVLTGHGMEEAPFAAQTAHVQVEDLWCAGVAIQRILTQDS